MKTITSTIAIGAILSTALFTTTGFASPYSEFFTPKPESKGIEVVTAEAFKTIIASEKCNNANNQVVQSDAIKQQKMELVDKQIENALATKSE
jgi:hypothetical protein